jgi:pSer/pThr/pTyr-binding forkhead associated (FHA) protein
MKGRLLYRDAQGRDSAADLVPEGSFVGRAAECVVRTDDAMVSRRNCKLFREGATWYVEDLNSSNGTFVNEKRVLSRTALSHADIVRCGTLQVRFVEVEEGPSVSVDPALSADSSEIDIVKRELESVLADRSEKEQRLFELGRELETIKLRSETDATELQRLRAEVVVQRDKATELSRVRQLTEEELNAQVRVGEQLRRDLEGLKKEHFELRERHDKTVGDLQARERQFERLTEDQQRTKQMLDETRARLAELERTKDAGWRELNARVGELDGLRAVIAEQERLLEERRVGLIALEASAQDLRQERERLLRELVTARSERDEAKNQSTSLRNQLEGLDEEHRRLQRAMSEGSGGSADEALKLATDLRQVRVSLKTVEAERDRLVERAERADAARAEAEQKLAKLDVERTQALEEKQRALSARERAEEALGRAELQRKAAEETRKGVEATDAKLVAEVDKLRSELDAARAETDDLRNQLDDAGRALARARDAAGEEVAARKRAEDALAVAQKIAATAPKTIETGARREHSTQPIEVEDVVGGTLDDATLNGGPRGVTGADDELRMTQLEEELASLGSELAIARAELESLRATPANGAGHADDGEQLREIQRRAQEAYNGVNDALSELRTNILLARRLVGELASDPSAAQSLADAIAISVDRAEDAKGILRSLREVVEA